MKRFVRFADRDVYCKNVLETLFSLSHVTRHDKGHKTKSASKMRYVWTEKEMELYLCWSKMSNKTMETQNSLVVHVPQNIVLWYEIL